MLRGDKILAKVLALIGDPVPISPQLMLPKALSAVVRTSVEAVAGAE